MKKYILLFLFLIPLFSLTAAKDCTIGANPPTYGGENICCKLPMDSTEQKQTPINGKVQECTLDHYTCYNDGGGTYPLTHSHSCFDIGAKECELGQTQQQGGYTLYCADVGNNSLKRVACRSDNDCTNGRICDKSDQAWSCIAGGNNTGNTGGSGGAGGGLGGGSQDCVALLTEIQGFGSMGPYLPEQQEKIDLSAQLKCSCGEKRYSEGGERKCCDGIVEQGKCITNNMGKMGIDITQECLINGQCKLDIYETLGIRQSLPKETRSSPGIFIQDIILSATFFVGTLITGVLIISGLLYVFAGANGSLAAKAKKGITGSLIGLVFVVGSYAFVRLIQFLITGGGG